MRACLIKSGEKTLLDTYGFNLNFKVNELGWTFLTEELCLLLTDSCNATSIVNPEKALLLLFRTQLASGLFSERSLESAFD